MNGDLTSLAQKAAKLFENMFAVRCRAIDTYHSEDIARFGIATLGDSRADAKVQNNMTDCYWTIATMVEYVKEGVNFYMRTDEEAHKAYVVIDEYLAELKRVSELAFSIEMPPMEDLAALDRLAEMLYGYHVSHQILENYRNPTRPTGASPYSVVGFRKAVRPNLATIKPPARQSYIEYFSTFFSQRGMSF